MSISQYILNPKEEYLAEVILRSKWMIRIRWIYVSLLTIVAVLSTLATSNNKQVVVQYIFIGSFGLIANGVLWLALLKKSDDAFYYKINALFQISIDVVMASLIIFLQGGLTSRATILYALPILISGVLFLGLFAILAAIFSSAGYLTSLLAYHYTNPAVYRIKDIVVPGVFYSCVYLLIAAVVLRFSTINAMNARESSYSQLMAMLRHQLRRPSSAIAALIDSLEHNNFDALTPDHQKRIQQIKKENQLLNSMVENLLTASDTRSTLKKDELSNVNLIPLIEDSAKSVATAAKRTDDLKLEMPADSAIASAVPQQLTMALHNIIDNAFRYSKAGSLVTVRLIKTGSNYQITVRDFGKGIAPKHQKYLFQRFSSFEENKTKDSPVESSFTSGLGLYVSKLIIERHGGSLSLESAPGKGTIVTIRI